MSLLDEGISAYPLYLRSYYFGPIADRIIHIPTAVPKFGYLINNADDPVYRQSQQSLASSRKYRCSFAGNLSSCVALNETRLDLFFFVAGRLEYPETITHALYNDRTDLLTHGANVCTFMLGSTECTIENHELSYETYIDILSQTAFAPCPAGNNPETFRLYEVLTLCLMVSLLLVIVSAGA
jgi:hypothetical protein